MGTENDTQSRRDFIKKSIIAGSVLPFISEDLLAVPNGRRIIPLQVHVFSKHLQFLNYADLADAAAEIGFDGIDLTVRPNGHVLPDRVETDLPKAIEAIRKAGLSAKIMTTAVENANDSSERKVLETAAGLGITHYRMNWLKYPEEKDIPEAIRQFKKTVKDLSHLNRTLGLTGCYQNHSGNLAGASLWELWEILKDADQQYMGVQYDIRHAVVEGGLSWQNGLRLIHPQIKMLTLKDFVWLKKNGTWRAEDVPLGEGMVDLKAYFSLLKKFNIQVPLSLHFEYPLGGAEHGSSQISTDKKIIFAAMKRDLLKVKELWEQV